MARGRTTPSFLLLSTDDGRRADWKHRLRRHGSVRVVDSVEGAKSELEPGKRRWLAFIVDVDGDGRSVQRLLKQMRRASPQTPGLLVTETRPRATEYVTDASFRFLARSAPVAESRYFLGYALALEVTQDADVASAVEAIGRARSLTVKQMELTALAATPLSRDTLVEGLGVSHNTVKTRIRQLLRIHQEDSMDTLGKTVLRAALAHARGLSWSGVGASAGAMPAERKAVARSSPTAKAVPRRLEHRPRLYAR